MELVVDGGKACFQVEWYLRFADLFPELASSLVKEFEFPTASADAQTSVLDERTGRDLSAVVADMAGWVRVCQQFLRRGGGAGVEGGRVK